MHHASHRSLFLAILVVSPALAQEAPKPEWTVGDKWSFERKDRTRNVVEHVVDTTVASRTESEYHQRVVNTKTGTTITIVRDTNLNVTDFNGRKSTPAIVVYDWPLAAGKQWSAKFEGPNTARNGQYVEERKCEVAGRESIQVRAGTFDTVKVTCKGSYRTPSPSGNVTLSGYTESSLWYAPAAKIAVRYEYTDGNQFGRWNNWVDELIGFELQK